jgi:serine/threonine-protein kinase RsbT
MTEIERKIIETLKPFLGDILSKSMIKMSIVKAQIDIEAYGPEDCQPLLDSLKVGLGTFIHDAGRREQCGRKLEKLLTTYETSVSPPNDTIELEVKEEADIVRIRSAGRALCETIGFSLTDQTKITTVISELSRNIVLYAGTGTITISRLMGDQMGVEVVARDQGPGIADVEKIMNGKYKSKSGMGMGLIGSKKLMDDFDLKTAVGKGTTVTVRKYRT